MTGHDFRLCLLGDFLPGLPAVLAWGSDASVTEAVDGGVFRRCSVYDFGIHSTTHLPLLLMQGQSSTSQVRANYYVYNFAPDSQIL